MQLVVINLVSTRTSASLNSAWQLPYSLDVCPFFTNLQKSKSHFVFVSEEVLVLVKKHCTQT